MDSQVARKMENTAPSPLTSSPSPLLTPLDIRRRSSLGEDVTLDSPSSASAASSLSSRVVDLNDQPGTALTTPRALHSSSSHTPYSLDLTAPPSGSITGRFATLDQNQTELKSASQSLSSLFDASAALKEAAEHAAWDKIVDEPGTGKVSNCESSLQDSVADAQRNAREVEEADRYNSAIDILSSGSESRNDSEKSLLESLFSRFTSSGKARCANSQDLTKQMRTSDGGSAPVDDVVNRLDGRDNFNCKRSHSRGTATCGSSSSDDDAVIDSSKSSSRLHNLGSYSTTAGLDDDGDGDVACSIAATNVDERGGSKVHRKGGSKLSILPSLSSALIEEPISSSKKASSSAISSSYDTPSIVASGSTTTTTTPTTASAYQYHYNQQMMMMDTFSSPFSTSPPSINDTGDALSKNYRLQRHKNFMSSLADSLYVPRVLQHHLFASYRHHYQPPKMSSVSTSLSDVDKGTNSDASTPPQLRVNEEDSHYQHRSSLPLLDGTLPSNGKDRNRSTVGSSGSNCGFNWNASSLNHPSLDNVLSFQNFYPDTPMLEVKACLLRALDSLRDAKPGWAGGNDGDNYLFHFKQLMRLSSSMSPRLVSSRNQAAAASLPLSAALPEGSNPSSPSSFPQSLSSAEESSNVEGTGGVMDVDDDDKDNLDIRQQEDPVGARHESRTSSLSTPRRKSSKNIVVGDRKGGRSGSGFSGIKRDGQSCLSSAMVLREVLSSSVVQNYVLIFAPMLMRSCLAKSLSEVAGDVVLVDMTMKLDGLRQMMSEENEEQVDERTLQLQRAYNENLKLQNLSNYASHCLGRPALDQLMNNYMRDIYGVSSFSSSLSPYPVTFSRNQNLYNGQNFSHCSAFTQVPSSGFNPQHLPFLSTQPSSYSPFDHKSGHGSLDPAPLSQTPNSSTSIAYVVSPTGMSPIGRKTSGSASVASGDVGSSGSSHLVEDDEEAMIRGDGNLGMNRRTVITRCSASASLGQFHNAAGEKNSQAVQLPLAENSDHVDDPPLDADDGDTIGPSLVGGNSGANDGTSSGNINGYPSSDLEGRKAKRVGTTVSSPSSNHQIQSNKQGESNDEGQLGTDDSAYGTSTEMSSDGVLNGNASDTVFFPPGLFMDDVQQHSQCVAVSPSPFDQHQLLLQHFHHPGLQNQYHPPQIFQGGRLPSPAAYLFTNGRFGGLQMDDGLSTPFMLSNGSADVNGCGGAVTSSSQMSSMTGMVNGMNCVMNGMQLDGLVIPGMNGIYSVSAPSPQRGGGSQVVSMNGIGPMKMAKLKGMDGHMPGSSAVPSCSSQVIPSSVLVNPFMPSSIWQPPTSSISQPLVLKNILSDTSSVAGDVRSKSSSNGIRQLTSPSASVARGTSSVGDATSTGIAIASPSISSSPASSVIATTSSVATSSSSATGAADPYSSLADEELRPIRGVYFDRAQKAWIGSFYQDGRQVKKRFKISAYGFEPAKQMAMTVRLDFEKRVARDPSSKSSGGSSAGGIGSSGGNGGSVVAAINGDGLGINGNSNVVGVSATSSGGLSGSSVNSSISGNNGCTGNTGDNVPVVDSGMGGKDVSLSFAAPSSLSHATGGSTCSVKRPSLSGGGLTADGLLKSTSQNQNFETGSPVSTLIDGSTSISPSTVGVDGDGNESSSAPSPILSELTNALSTKDLPMGVFYTSRKHAYCANWYANGRQQKKYFPISKLGEMTARNMAIAARTNYERNMRCNGISVISSGGAGGGSGAASSSGSCGGSIVGEDDDGEEDEEIGELACKTEGNGGTGVCDGADSDATGGDGCDIDGTVSPGEGVRGDSVLLSFYNRLNYDTPSCNGATNGVRRGRGDGEKNDGKGETDDDVECDAAIEQNQDDDDDVVGALTMMSHASRQSSRSRNPLSGVAGKPRLEQQKNEKCEGSLFDTEGEAEGGEDGDDENEKDEDDDEDEEIGEDEMVFARLRQRRHQAISNPDIGEKKEESVGHILLEGGDGLSSSAVKITKEIAAAKPANNVFPNGLSTRLQRQTGNPSSSGTAVVTIEGGNEKSRESDDGVVDTAGSDTVESASELPGLSPVANSSEQCGNNAEALSAFILGERSLCSVSPQSTSSALKVSEGQKVSLLSPSCDKTTNMVTLTPTTSTFMGTPTSASIETDLSASTLPLPPSNSDNSSDQSDILDRSLSITPSALTHPILSCNVTPVSPVTPPASAQASSTILTPPDPPKPQVGRPPLSTKNEHAHSDYINSISSIGVKTGLTPTSPSLSKGFNGVYMIRINGAAHAWRAEWKGKDGYKKTKNFSISQFGKEAKKLAIELRARMARELLVADDGTCYDYRVNASPAGSSDDANSDIISTRSSNGSATADAVAGADVELSASSSPLSSPSLRNAKHEQDGDAVSATESFEGFEERYSPEQDSLSHVHGSEGLVLPSFMSCSDIGTIVNSHVSENTRVMESGGSKSTSTSLVSSAEVSTPGPKRFLEDGKEEGTSNGAPPPKRVQRVLAV